MNDQQDLGDSHVPRVALTPVPPLTRRIEALASKGTVRWGTLGVGLQLVVLVPGAPALSPAGLAWIIPAINCCFVLAGLSLVTNLVCMCRE